MEMVRVDPKLFVTCRLCLEEMGMYQITPVVQHQIKYCFDIDVDQFDGLPQLICSQCETILSEYFTKKRIFVGRQNALKAKIEVRKEVEGDLCSSPPHEAVSSSQQNDNEEITTRQKATSKPKKRKSRIISSSSSSTVASLPASRETTCSPAVSLNTDSSIINKKTKEKIGPKKRRESWEANYTKRYGCKLCNKCIKFGGGIGNHIKTHANLLSKYRDIISKTCEVKLNKIDDKPNPTGNTDTVALTQDKIIGQQKENVYIIYGSKEDSRNGTAENIEVEKRKVSYVESENDDDEILNTSKQAKRRRLLSGSSTDTVVLNDDDKNPTSHAGKQEKQVIVQKTQADEDIECINIDDSSNDSTQSDHVGDDVTNPITPKDVEAIRNLIRVCHSKYLAKRQEMLEAETKQAANKGPQLKRKLLSMGRKVIHRQGLGCTGLLRFMESKNLDIKWIPSMSGNKETNLVRIMPRVKSKDELVPDNNGWKKKPEIAKDGYVRILPIITPKTNSNISETSQTPNNSAPADVSVGNYLSGLNITITQNSNKVINSPYAASTEIETSDLFKDCDTKLLNAYPVANPKQLPRKSNNTESKLQQATIEKVVEKELTEYPQQRSLYIDLDDEQLVSNIEMPMPVITSTTSLAVSQADDKEIKTEQNGSEIANEVDKPASEAEKAASEAEKRAREAKKPANEADKPAGEVGKPANEIEKPVNEEVKSANEAEKPAPRIKVKPASELMSQSVLQKFNQSNVDDNIYTGNNGAPAISTANGLGLVITQVTSGGVPVTPTQLIPPAHSEGPATVTNSRNYVILDTVEMPNTKTESPVQYLRNLLHFHSIILLNSNEPPPLNAICLIRFKLQLSRDKVTPPVTFCLSVHCAGNKFALGVRNENQEFVNLNSLSANWQCEILKIYTVRPDIINKMLQNAEKVSQEVYDLTKTFTCLLKSINFKKGVC